MNEEDYKNGSPVYQENSQMAFFLGAPPQFLPERTQNRPSMCLTGMPHQQLQSHSPEHYRKAMDMLPNTCMTPVPGNSGNLIAYKLCNTSSTLPQEVAKADAHSSLVSVEASLKREQRLMKNREAVRESRVKKKEYIKCLEDRMYLLENINKTLTREIKALKDTHAQNTPCSCCK